MPETFRCRLEWTGATGGPLEGTAYSRDLDVQWEGLPPLPMSAAPAYKGDPTRLNPEQLFVASLSSCQALTYLFLAARSGVGLLTYVDDAEGTLSVVDGKMRMSSVTLRPTITLRPGADEAKALALVEKAHEGCFIANSVATEVILAPRVQFQET